MYRAGTVLLCLSGLASLSIVLSCAPPLVPAESSTGLPSVTGEAGSPPLPGDPSEPPVADAGPDQRIVDNDGDGWATVTLDGSGSRGGVPITAFRWRYATLTLADEPVAEVDLPEGVHSLMLEVTDALGRTARDQTWVFVLPPPNALPQARLVTQDAVDMNDNGWEPVHMDATASSDPDGRITRHQWFIDGREAGEGPALTVPLSVGTHHVLLVVFDDRGGAATQRAVISVRPAPRR